MVVAPGLHKEKAAVSDDAPVHLNGDNNVVWKTSIKPQATESFLLHYSVETPRDSAPVVFH